jgi:hypothetical protein
MAKGQRPSLPPDEEARLKQIVATEKGTLGQRAKAILAWLEGATANDAGRQSGLSPNQVQYLINSYKRKGLDLFLVDSESISPAVTEAPPPPPEAPNTTTIEALCKQYNVDLAHAGHVANLAATLFEGTANLHRLPHTFRPLLEAAAIVHNLAYEIDQPNHHTRGRDMIMAQPLRGYTDDERRILACTTAFHRKKVKPETEPIFAQLSPELQRDTLILSALLRVADGLDNSQTQTTTLQEVVLQSGELLLMLEGPHAESDGEQAEKKADLWKQVFPNMRVRSMTEPAEAAPAPDAKAASKALKLAAPPVRPAAILLPGNPQISAAMSIINAGKAFTLHTLSRVEGLLRNALAGDTSQMSSLIRECYRLGEAANMAGVEALQPEIDWLCEALTPIRDVVLCVEQAHIAAEEVADGKPYLGKASTWEASIKAALKAFDSPRFKAMVSVLRNSLSQEASNAKNLVGYHVGAIMWDHLAALREVMEQGTSVDDALVAVRRLQDNLYGLRSLLGSEASQVIDILSPLEGYLTAIQTAQGVLAQLDVKPPAKRGRKPAAQPEEVVIADLKGRVQSQLDRMADDLMGVWGAVNSPSFRRTFALAVAAP